MSPDSNVSPSAASERRARRYHPALVLAGVGLLGIALGLVSTQLKYLTEQGKIERRCEKGDPSACMELADLVYEEAEHDAETQKKVLTLRTRACELGDRNACDYVGSMYANGEEFAKVDQRLATQFFIQACNRGRGEDCHIVGMRYEEGKGVLQSPDFAFYFYDKACRAGGLSHSCTARERLRQGKSSASAPQPAPPTSIESQSAASPASLGNPPSPAANLVPVQPVAAATGSGVYMNAVELALDAARAVQLPQGRYWYDPKSGLWGVQGAAPAGLTTAGLPTQGALRQDASGGNTDVLINGRNITTAELATLFQIFGVAFPPGRYSLDAQTNLGPEGQPPQFNVAARLNLLGALAGAGRDNFWMTKHASGNFNSQGGYVCGDSGGDFHCYSSF